MAPQGCCVQTLMMPQPCPRRPSGRWGMMTLTSAPQGGVSCCEGAQLWLGTQLCPLRGVALVWGCHPALQNSSVAPPAAAPTHLVKVCLLNSKILSV